MRIKWKNIHKHQYAWYWNSYLYLMLWMFSFVHNIYFWKTHTNFPWVNFARCQELRVLSLFKARLRCWACQCFNSMIFFKIDTSHAQKRAEKSRKEVFAFDCLYKCDKKLFMLNKSLFSTFSLIFDALNKAWSVALAHRREDCSHIIYCIYTHQSNHGMLCITRYSTIIGFDAKCVDGHLRCCCFNAVKLYCRMQRWSFVSTRATTCILSAP